MPTKWAFCHMSPFSWVERRTIAIPSKRRETLKEEIYQTHAFTPNTSPRTTHAPLAFLTAPLPSPGITQNNQHKQPQNRCDSDRPYRYESHRHHRCDSHRFKSSRCVHFDQSEATFQDWKKHGFTHHFTSTTNVHPYLPQAATRLIRCSNE